MIIKRQFFYSRKEIGNGVKILKATAMAYFEIQFQPSLEEVQTKCHIACGSYEKGTGIKPPLTPFHEVNA